MPKKLINLIRIKLTVSFPPHLRHLFCIPVDPQETEQSDQEVHASNMDSFLSTLASISGQSSSFATTARSLQFRALNVLLKICICTYQASSANTKMRIAAR